MKKILLSIVSAFVLTVILSVSVFATSSYTKIGVGYVSQGKYRTQMFISK